MNAAATDGPGAHRYRSRKRDLRYHDERSRVAGMTLSLTASSQKLIGFATGHSKGWISKLIAGHPAAGRYLELVDGLDAHQATDAAPLVVAPLAQFLTRHVVGLDLDELDQAERIVAQREAEAEGRENLEATRHIYGSGSDEHLEALMDEVAAEVAWIAILLERRYLLSTGTAR